MIGSHLELKLFLDIFAMPSLRKHLHRKLVRLHKRPRKVACEVNASKATCGYPPLKLEQSRN